MDIRDGEMSVVNNCGDHDCDRDTESNEPWVLKDRAACFPPLSPVGLKGQFSHGLATSIGHLIRPTRMAGDRAARPDYPSLRRVA